MASNPKLLSYIEDKIKALIETRVQKLSELEVDDALSDTSGNPVQNKVIKAALDDKLDIADIDDELSDTSENPVQNKEVYANAGVFYKGTPTMDGSPASICSWIQDNYIYGRWITGKPIISSAASDAIFGSASFVIMACCTSRNYGFGYLISDSTAHGGFVTFRISQGNLVWRSPYN